MQIDTFTVLLFGLFLKLVLGGLFVAFWTHDRRATWYAWWSGTFFLGSVAAVLFLVRGITADMLSIGLGNTALVAAFACSWQAARAFNARATSWLAVVAPAAVWFAACFVPGFTGNIGYRVILSSVLIAFMLGASAVEFWRGRHEHLPSRWVVIVLFATFALFFVSRIVLVDVLPFPFGAQPMQPGWLGAFNLVMFFHTVLLTVLVVSMSKERLEREQRIKAQTDPLTGALNRRAFIARGGRLLQRHQHENEPLCLLFLDLDHFKALNDRHGHSGGDDVLMNFVAVVHDNIRPTDFLFRIGGEEFCCVLPYTTTEQASVVVGHGAVGAGGKPAFEHRRRHVQRCEPDDEPDRGLGERVGRRRRKRGIGAELPVEQQNCPDQDDRRGEADEAPCVIVVAEDRRAEARVARHDVQQNLPAGDDRPDHRGQQRQAVLAGLGPIPDVQDGAYRQQGKLDALQETQRAGQLAEHELRTKGRRQHECDGIEAERVGGDRERGGHRAASERQLQNVGGVVHVGCGRRGEREQEQGHRRGARAEPCEQHDDEDRKEQRAEFHASLSTRSTGTWNGGAGRSSTIAKLL